MPKEKIRNELKQKRARISSDDAYEAGTRLVQLLSPWISKSSVWLLYSEIQNEISTKPLFETLRAKNICVGFPKVIGDALEFKRVDRLDELTPGRFGLEPSGLAPTLDLKAGIVVVPGIGFSNDGHRIGFGKGYYDRFLQQCPNLLRLGLAYDFQITLNRLPIGNHDQIMDYVVTPAGIWGSRRT